jgi:hypothetical protein
MFILCLLLDHYWGLAVTVMACCMFVSTKIILLAIRTIACKLTYTETIQDGIITISIELTFELITIVSNFDI